MKRDRPFSQSRCRLLNRACLAGLRLVVLCVVFGLVAPATEAGASEATTDSGITRNQRVLQPAPKFSDIASAAESAPVGKTNGAVQSDSTANLPGQSMETLDDKQKLGVGDRVTFRVLEDQEEPKPLTITDAGELDVPELGLVAAAGKTCKQLAFELKPKLEQVSYYRATVIIGIDLLNKTISGRRVYVSGQVQRPGPQEIPAGETWTVAKALMRAGGFTPYGDKKRVRVVRAGAKGQPGKTLTVNVAEVLEKGRTELDLSVEPEDLIYVPARGVNFY